ncbi:Hypothetical protein WANG_1743 [Lactobacillus kefiranofaciens subsp. kefiranofaciens]|nr:Hypothetical protein WANG_1743 [Lactobacillus kefiranofaciens subsp. kefiranofaciens]KRM20153.1 hypothetical protein FC93_GL001828 [Lactobacillus kefiranofaciens subsp. kefiranofaciens DSM 5016 = JCM 6985]
MRSEISRSNIKANNQTKKYIGNPKNFQLINRTNLVASTLKRSNNKSGVIGVSWDKTAQKWVARLYLQGRLVLNRVYGRLQELTEHCKLLKNLSWGLPVECFHWSRIDPMINLI